MQQGRENLDAVIVGAGFGGLYMLHSLRSQGLRAIIVEAASDVGGAWYWNRYPGARCDVESLVYSYSFSPELDAEWQWSERYAAQPEIQAYLRFASERLNLRPDIIFDTRVTQARFIEDDHVWEVTCDSGAVHRARFCIMATGPISVPALPDIPGIENFTGKIVHTARWPQQGLDLSGKRVGVVGTGSSGTQLIPMAAEAASRLTVFQRTANFTVPARNAPLDSGTQALWAARRQDIRQAMWRGEVAGAGDIFMPNELRMTRVAPAANFTREQRLDIMNRRWEFGGAVLQGSFKDVMTDEAVNAEVADFVREKIRGIVKDPVRAAMLIPKGFALGTRRICVGTNYYETFNRANVDLVDVKATPISRFTKDGVVVGDREIPLDILAFATGFDALTGALTSIDIRGEQGVSINDAWAHGPRTYLGMSIMGFPNLFLIGGPGSPSVFSNVVMTNEYQVDFITQLMISMRDQGQTKIHVSDADQDVWTARVNEIATHTLLAKADSWYVGANIPGKPKVILAFIGGVANYRKICDEIREDGFRGFHRALASSPAA